MMLRILLLLMWNILMQDGRAQSYDPSEIFRREVQIDGRSLNSDDNNRSNVNINNNNNINNVNNIIINNNNNINIINNNNNDENHRSIEHLNQSMHYSIRATNESDNGNSSAGHRNPLFVAVETRKTPEKSRPAIYWSERNADDFRSDESMSLPSSATPSSLSDGGVGAAYPGVHEEDVLLARMHYRSSPLLSLNLPFSTPLSFLSFLSSSLQRSSLFSSSTSSSMSSSSSLMTSSLLATSSSSSSSSSSSLSQRSLRRVRKHDSSTPNHALTFTSSEAFVVTKWKIYSSFELKFKIRTFANDGLIFFTSAGIAEKDFLAVEITDGQIRHSYDTGNGPRTMVVKRHRKRSSNAGDVTKQDGVCSAGACTTSGVAGKSESSGVLVNDSKWHEVSVSRDATHVQMLSVDGYTTRDYMQDGRSVHFDLNDDVFIGGAPRHVIGSLPRQVKSTSGYHGCVGDVVYNKRVRNLLSGHHGNKSRDVKVGCAGPSKECSSVACNNKGICRQEWLSFSCDCQLTGYVGPNCSAEGVAACFGGSGGLLTYSYPDSAWPDTDLDRLALRFITSKSNGIIIRIISGTSNDFIELAVADGYLYATYNMGLTNHTVGFNATRVNDGEVHRVVFVRVEANSSLWVDQSLPAHKNTTGFQLTTFNHQMKVFVGGGGKNDAGIIIKPFIGNITGLSWNGLNILQLKETGSTAIKTYGHVVLGEPFLGSNIPLIDSNEKHPTTSITTQARDTTVDRYTTSTSSGKISDIWLKEDDDALISCDVLHEKFEASRLPARCTTPSPTMPSTNPLPSTLLHPLMVQYPTTSDHSPTRITRVQTLAHPATDGVTIDLESLKEELLGSEDPFENNILNTFTSEENNVKDRMGERRIFLIKQITLASAVLFGTGIFVGLVGLALYKIKIRNQGTYKVNNRQGYFYEPCSTSNHCLNTNRIQGEHCCDRIQQQQQQQQQQQHSKQTQASKKTNKEKSKSKKNKSTGFEVGRREDREWYV